MTDWVDFLGFWENWIVLTICIIVTLGYFAGAIGRSYTTIFGIVVLFGGSWAFTCISAGLIFTGGKLFYIIAYGVCAVLSGFSAVLNIVWKNWQCWEEHGRRNWEEYGRAAKCAEK